MITDIQMDSLIRAIREKRILIEQVPDEVKSRVEELMSTDDVDEE